MKNYLKKNKALFILPLALIPFLVLIFYILGGGENANGELAENSKPENQKGANYILPEADKSIEILDKLEAYQKQGGKVLVRTTDVLGEPDSVLTDESSTGVEQDTSETNLILLAQNSPDVSDKLLLHIKRKETEIKRELEVKPEPKVKGSSGGGNKRINIARSVTNKKVTKRVNIEDPKNLPVYRATGIEELDKVFDENSALTRQNDSLKFYLEQSQMQLTQIGQKKKVGFTMDKKQVSGFDGDEDKNTLIKAEIYETTTVLNDNRVKLRLLEDTWVNEKKVPKNAFIYGICKIKNERLHIDISQLPVGENFLPVNLAIHDLDGLPGLYVPDNVARKVTQEVGAGTNTSSLMGVSNDPLTYVGIRAADQTAQTFLKRIRLKKVTLKKNTLVYIINTKQ